LIATNPVGLIETTTANAKKVIGAGRLLQFRLALTVTSLAMMLLLLFLTTLSLIR